MKLRCIGGPKDGQWEEISNDCRLYDQVRFHLPQKLTILNSDIIEELFEHSQITYVYYIVDEIKWHEKSGLESKTFLRFIEWSTWQCIEHQFDKKDDERKEKIIDAVKEFILYGKNENIAKIVHLGHYLLEE